MEDCMREYMNGCFRNPKDITNDQPTQEKEDIQLILD